MTRRVLVVSVTVVALGLVSGQQLLAQAPHASPGACDAGAALGSPACRVFYRGHLISQYEREGIERTATGGGAVMTPDGVFLFDTTAEVDRFDARRIAAARAEHTGE